MSWATATHRVGELLPAGVRPAARVLLVRYRQMGLRSADAVLVSYPKSGSTWMRFLLGHVLAGEEVDFDSIRDLIPPCGRHRHAPALLGDGGRVVRTHEPLDRLSKRPGRIVYLVRDGRSVAGSYFHHLHRIGVDTGSPSEYLERFVRGEIDYYGPWERHVLGANRAVAEHPDRFQVVRYEDMAKNAAAVLAGVLEFLGRPAGEDSIVRSIDANSKDRMRAKEAGSRILQSQNVDGSSVVSHRSQDFTELFGEEAAAEFESAAGPALRAFGYLPSGAAKATDQSEKSRPINPDSSAMSDL